MAEAGFFALDEPHPRVAVGYVPPAGEGGRWTSNVYALPPVGGPDGGAQCTARDLDRFLAALTGGGLLRPESRATFLAPHAALPDGSGDAYGYGVWLLGTGGPPRVALEGEDLGCSARAVWYPGLGARAVVLANVSAAAGPVARLISTLLGGG
jgi:CubicO group peptidase (beta-lactamase class C family)